MEPINTAKRGFEAADVYDSGDEPILPFPKMPKPLSAEDAALVRAHVNEDFRKFLKNNLPLKLASSWARYYMVQAARHLMMQAFQNGVTIDQLQIGPDCLPCWEGKSYDPTLETLTTVIQDALTQYAVSHSLGPLLYEELAWKSRYKLAKARAMGLELIDIEFRDDMLPSWEGDDTRLELDPTQPHSPDTPCSEVGYEYVDWLDLDTNNLPTAVHTGSPDLPGPDWSDWAAKCVGFSKAARFARFNSDDESDCSSIVTLDFNSDFEEDGDGDTDVELNNPLFDVPVIEEPECNVIYDAQILFEGTVHEVDLEVYAIDCEEDDEELNAMPTVELLVDREGYEHHYDTTHAVDIEFPNMDVYCTDQHLLPAQPRISPAAEEQNDNALPAGLIYDPEPVIEDPDDEDDEEDVESTASEEVTSESDVEEEEEPARRPPRLFVTTYRPGPFGGKITTPL
ncbi:hypothetical protein S40288_04403 [Stachybotrys chartarum IBT 40288]|nr:hypothetical protein S40288_04403 [Stachybotrys chartarum IBT 40288]